VWHCPGWNYDAKANASALVNGRIIYVPIFVGEATVYDRIGVEVIGAVAATLDLRIYSWDAGLPAGLVLDAGNIDMTLVGLKSIVIAQLLPRGYYFLAQRTAAGAGGILEGLSPTSIQTIPVSGINQNQAQSLKCCPYVDAAWSDPAPAPTSYVLTTDNSIQLRTVIA
jgi:hypothetical protein